MLPNTEQLREQLLQAEKIPAEILQLIHREKWLQIWVSKKFGGIDKIFHEGLELLFELAKTDGSLGWFVTLCSGANYFSKNLKPEIAREIFSGENVCFGGSGMIGGTAEIINKNEFCINGKWRYATGSPYLSHFTLNAKITANNKILLDENGNEKFLSFVLPKEKVDVFADWNAMGMRATNTFSFAVNDIVVSKDYGFEYDKFFTQDNSSNIPFRVFADLTLLVNYIGMARHFAEEVEKIAPQINASTSSATNEELKNYSKNVLKKAFFYASEMEALIANKDAITEVFSDEIHLFGEETVADLSTLIISTYIQVGIKASSSNSAINQVFRDFFTATQHANFRKKNN